MEAAARAFAGDGSTTVIGGGRLALPGAVLLNGYEITAATVCDVHRAILCHVTPTVVPPALALGERLEADGQALLVALAAGMEVAVRVGLAMDYPRFRSRGWHSPGVVGPFGGAAAAASLLRLGPRATRDALAFGGSQAAGTFAGLGSSQVKFHQARAGVSGLLGAVVAAEGFDAASRILTDPDGGMLRTYADGGTPGRLLDGLGERWELLQIALRRWPAASGLQAVVQACLELAPVATSPGSIESVRVELPPSAYRMHGATGWGDQLAALQSARYVGGVVLHDGRCWLEQFDPSRIADPELTEFVQERVTAVVNDGLSASGGVVTCQVAGGGTRSARVEIPLGDPRSPMDEDAVIAKLGDAASGTPLADRTRKIVDLTLGLDDLPSVSRLTTALREPARRARA